MGTLPIAKESDETIATVSLDDLFADEVESTSDDQVKEINDILEHAIELSSTVPCFNPLKERDLPSSFKGGTDVDHDRYGQSTSSLRFGEGSRSRIAFRAYDRSRN